MKVKGDQIIDDAHPFTWDGHACGPYRSLSLF
jgi:hypothetical protein